MLNRKQEQLKVFGYGTLNYAKQTKKSFNEIPTSSNWLDPIGEFFVKAHVFY